MEKVYISFTEIIDLIVNSGGAFSPRNIIKVTNTIKSIYKNEEIFKFVFEQIYSDPKNPFTTAYYEFMIFKQSGYDLDDICYTLAENILIRRYNEKKSGEYITF